MIKEVRKGKKERVKVRNAVSADSDSGYFVSYSQFLLETQPFPLEIMDHYLPHFERRRSPSSSPLPAVGYSLLFLLQPLAEMTSPQVAACGPTMTENETAHF